MVSERDGEGARAAPAALTDDPEHDTIGSPRPPGRRTGLILATIAAVLVALIVWHVVSRPTETRGTPPQTVSVAAARRGDMPVTLDEIGTVTPTATVTVLPNASVSGYLTHVYFHEGEDVRKGQLLAEIDPRPYAVLRRQAMAALAKDEAMLAQAQYDFSLYQRLNAKQAIAAQTAVDQKYLVQQQTAAVAADRASIAQYDLDIAYCHITAPVSGRAGLRLVDPGNYITGSASSGIVTLTTLQPMLVQFGVAQNDLAKVAARFSAPGGKLPVTAFDSSTNQPIATGTLYAIGNQMNTGTGQTPMRATFANADHRLWPNAFVNLRIVVDTLRGATLVPTKAVLTGAPGTYVFLVRPGNTVGIRKITLGPSDGTNTVVTSGLRPGDQVVTDGTDRLSDQAKIRIAGRPGGGAGGGEHHGHHHP